MKKEDNNILTLANCPDLMDVKQVAKLLQVSEKTITNLTDSCQLDSFKIGRSRRYTKRAVLKFIYEQTGDEAYNVNAKQATYNYIHQSNNSGIEAMM